VSLISHQGIIPLEDALAEIKRGKGEQLDSQVLEIFLNEKIYQ
jgi:HD-GYP domain-containing protein (c-di-GMP phosphodiesterase class II)